MKALVKVGYGCNNHCTFCHTLDVREIDADTVEVDRKIDRAARLGHTMIVLSGGEVTMRKELLRWAARSAARGLDFGLVTNGRMLAYAELVDRLMKLRLRYVYMSLHGGTAKLHNSLVRADAFEQTYAAVGNLAGRGLDFTVNTVVTRQNVDHLRGVVDALLPWPDVVVKFSMVQPKGGGEKLFEHLMPRVSDVAAKVKDAIEYGLEKSGGRQGFTHDGIPFCLLPGHEQRYDDLKTHRFATMIEVGEPDFFPVDDLAKVQPDDECGRCAVRGPCPGLYAGYREVHGDGEVRAVTGRARSNSFTYVHEATHGRLAAGDQAAACPVRTDGVTPWDRGRILFLREGDRVERYRTQSRDFTDVEIAHTKLQLGQVYDDISAKDAPDDFARDLAALRRSAVCDPCAERDRCGGLWERTGEDVFTRDDRRVRDALGQLRGDVLDVGCGEGRYEDLGRPRSAGWPRAMGRPRAGRVAGRSDEGARSVGRGAPGGGRRRRRRGAVRPRARAAQLEPLPRSPSRGAGPGPRPSPRRHAARGRQPRLRAASSPSPARSLRSARRRQRSRVGAPPQRRRRAGPRRALRARVRARDPACARARRASRRGPGLE